jgi:hypothetical protein
MRQSLSSSHFDRKTKLYDQKTKVNAHFDRKTKKKGTFVITHGFGKTYFCKSNHTKSKSYFMYTLSLIYDINISSGKNVGILFTESENIILYIRTGYKNFFNNKRHNRNIVFCNAAAFCLFRVQKFKIRDLLFQILRPG